MRDAVSLAITLAFFLARQRLCTIPALRLLAKNPDYT